MILGRSVTPLDIERTDGEQYLPRRISSAPRFPVHSAPRQSPFGAPLKARYLCGVGCVDGASAHHAAVQMVRDARRRKPR